MRWAAVLVLLAFFHRLCFLFSNLDRDWPFTIFYEGDSEVFFNYARALLQGALYDNGIPFHPPLFAWVLAGLHTLLGVGATSDPAANLRLKGVLAFLGSLPVGLLFLLARPYVGHGIALTAALLAAWHFGLMVLAIAPVTEGLYLSLFLGVLLAYTRRIPSPLSTRNLGDHPVRPLTAFAFGGLLGLLSLTRAEGVLIALVLVGLSALGGSQRRIRTPLAIALGFVLVVAPWTIRNAVRLGALNHALAGRLAEPLPRFVPITIYGPLNLALANHAKADGGFSREILSDAGHGSNLELTDPAHLELILHGERRALSFALDQPGVYLALATRKVGIYLGALRLGFTQWDLPGGLHGRRRAVDVFVPDSPLGTILLMPLMLLGMWVLWRRDEAARRLVGLVVLLTGGSLLVTLAFFGYARQGLLLVPLWLVLAASGAAWLGDRLPAVRAISSRRRSALARGLVLLLLLAEGIGAFSNRDYVASGETLSGSSRLNPDRPMELRVR